MKGRSKILLTIFLIIGILCIGSIFFNYGLFSANTVKAIDVLNTLDQLGDNSPIGALLSNEIRLSEEGRANELLEKKREVLEARRIKEEEARKEEEILALEKDPNSKFAYLTFDDGPSPNSTPAILDILAEYNIKATFFVVGSMVEQNPEILQRVYDEGHTIGNHTYTHNYRYIYRNTKNFMEDVNRADRILKDVLGEDFETNLFRFPGGSFGKNKAPMIRAIKKAGYTFYDWNALNGDSEGLNLKNSYLINRLKVTTKNKKDAIILMHDLDSKKGTVETLRRNLDYLISEGFYFRVLEEKNQ